MVNIIDIINLYDGNFFGTSSSVPHRAPEGFKWNKQTQNWNGLTVFTDSNIRISPQINSTKKVFWVMEPRPVWRTYDPELEFFHLTFDLEDPALCGIITHDQPMLDKYPDKTFKSIVGGCWVHDWCEYKLDTKNNKHILADNPIYKVSNFVSWKDATSGHGLRHQVAQKYPSPLTFDNTHVDNFGTGVRKFLSFKEPAMNPYLFHIAIENSQTINYFSEKLIDCFATSCVPLYWGCPNISDYFNPDGIITWNTLEDLDEILYQINSDPRGLYASKEEAIRENFEKAKEYICTDTWIYNNILKEILHAD